MHRKYLLGNYTYNNETSTFMTEIECSSKWHIFITTCPHPILLAIQIKRVWIELLTQKSLSINMISTWSGEINPTSRNEKYLFTSKFSYSYIYHRILKKWPRPPWKGFCWEIRYRFLSKMTLRKNFLHIFPCRIDDFRPYIWKLPFTIVLLNVTQRHVSQKPPLWWSESS